MGFDAKNLLYKTSFATTLSDLNKGWGGIWMSGQGLTVDTAGNLYCVTGNGQFTFNADMSKMKDWGMCYLKFGIDSKGRISVKDYFAPSDRDAWNAADLDLGSAGAMMIPETNLILGGSKTGILYLLNTDNMGQFVQSAKDGNAYEALPATTGEIHGAPVYYNSPVLGRTVFVWGDNDVLKGFSFTRDQKLAAEPIGRSVDGAPDPGGILSISSNANQDGTGIVWANRRQSGNQLSGVLQAYDADTLIDDGSGQPKFNLLWDSEQVSSRDSLGNFAKFTPPTIANGKVYMATFGTDATAIGTGGLAVYGLLPTTAPATPATLIAKPGNSQVELDWPVSPGAYRYFVYKGTDPANLSVIANEVLAPTGATMGTYLDNDVTNGTTYYYQVSAVNPAGESAPTNTVNATPNSLLSLIAVADSFVRTGTDANRKFGTDPLLNVSPTETLYVRFDLTQFRGSAVTTAYLQLYASAGSNVNSVYEVADNTWKEDTITANNAPPLGAKISSNVTTLGSGYTSWDITALVRKYKDSGLKFLNLAVKRDTANTVADVFNSRDLGVNPPKITVVVPDYPNYPNGFGNSESMVLNGLTTVAGSNLRLTDYLPGTASSAFFDRKVDITKFKTRFVYNPTKATAEGMTFCIQASDPTVVGNSGAGLGYQYLVDRSVAFKVDIFNNVGEGDSSIGIFTNGKLPTVPSTNLVNTPINFKWGHTYQFDIAYDGWNFNVTIKDLVTGRYTSSKFTVNIPSIIGGNTAYVGFTASTGVLVSRQDVTSWTMSK